jgi:hypothetical protein
MIDTTKEPQSIINTIHIWTDMPDEELDGIMDDLIGLGIDTVQNIRDAIENQGYECEVKSIYPSPWWNPFTPSHSMIKSDMKEK